MKFQKLIVLVLAFMLPVAVNAAVVQEGEASYYSDKLHGNKTASGEIYDKEALTAAHRTFAFGTKVKVTNLETGKSVDVVINDRGPRAKNLIIDVSGAAARELGMIEAGHIKVRVEAQAP